MITEKVNDSNTLPTIEELLGGMLVGKKVRWLSDEEKLLLKQEIERLVEETGYSRNEILDHFCINRIAYYDWIDPITEESLNQNKEREKK